VSGLTFTLKYAPDQRLDLSILTATHLAGLSEAEIASLSEEAIAATGASGPRDMGKVMGWLSPKTKGRADGKLVSQQVSAALARAAGGTGGRA
jgi:uncharacterized protein YqeY